MAADNREIRELGATLIVVGLSALVRVTPSAYGYAELLKIAAGSGTLEIVTPIYSGSSAILSGSSAVRQGTGYPIGTSEAITVGGPASFYLAATGATMTAALMVGFSTPKDQQ